MKTISNEDFDSVLVFLKDYIRTHGETLREKNLRRRASLLLRKMLKQAGKGNN